MPNLRAVCASIACLAFAACAHAPAEPPSSDIGDPLAGKAPNVRVEPQAPCPAQGECIEIRDGGFNDRAQPLFVVDGVPIDTRSCARRVSDIDPNDIESVTILKGPDAAAIFGAAGANGVVLLTMKSTRPDNPRLCSSCR